MSNRRFNVLSWENRHVVNAEQYAARIEMFYQLAIREAALIATTQQIDPTRPFRFADYPQTAARVNQFLSEMTSRITSTINEGTESEWLTANLKNDAFVESALGTVNLPRPALERFMSRNLEGLNAFQNRKINGLGLSDRVSRYTGQFKKELELGLDIGIGEGKSADAISRDIRKYLVEPEKLFRRVRDKRGALLLSKAATGYHPGQGVYRSSYKNSMRLARTEINMAYRESDHIRFQTLDFVVGFEVMLSPRHVITDICDDLKGRYPKEFKFVGWHPQCRCYVVSILATPAELRKLNQMILSEEDTSTFRSANEVTDVHDGFKEWVSKNTDRVARSASKPYFVRDNFVGGDIRKGLAFATAVQRINLVPDSLSNYESQLLITVDRGIFSLLKNPVPFRNDKDGAFFDLKDRFVNIAIDQRRKLSAWGAESVVYHEFGHAVDWEHSLKDRPELKTLMEKYRTKYSKADKFGQADILYKKIDKDLFTQGYRADTRAEYDTLNKVSAAHDTLMSLNYFYGQGHTIPYFKLPGRSEAEFIAHAFENHYIGNDVFEKAMPDLYKDMKKLVAQWIKELSPE